MYQCKTRITIYPFPYQIPFFQFASTITGIWYKFKKICVSLISWHLYMYAQKVHGNLTVAGEGLQILTYARHSWLPLSSEGSLTCHTHCDTGLPFIMVISEDPWHSHLLPSVWQWSYLFLRLRSVATGDRTQISRIRGEQSTSTPPPRSI